MGRDIACTVRHVSWNVRRLAIAAVAISLSLSACADAAGPPTGLAADHVLLAIDYIVDDPVLKDVYDPRSATLTADGSLVHERRDVDATFATTSTKLDAAGLRRVWAAISRSGIFTDGNLALPGFPQAGGPATSNVFRVDDGTRSTLLTIASLGSESIYTGARPIPAGEMALRAAATQLRDELRALGGDDPWTPPGLLLWWRTELPGDWNARIVAWSLPIDLASAGHPVDHQVWDRCVRLDGNEAAAVARFARSLPIDHLVERDGARYAINIRAIHPDEIDKVACP